MKQLIEAIKSKVGQFFGSRMPIGDSVTLNQKSIYILPTKAGFFLLGIVLLMMIGATNYQNNLAFVLTFLLIGLGLVTIVFTYKNLQGIQFSLNKPGEVFAGQSVPVAISLTSKANKKHFSIGVGFTNQEYVLTDVPESHFSKVLIKVQTAQRGWLKLPRIIVTSQFPFGWLRTWGYFGFAHKVLVYPKPIEPVILDRQDHGQETDEGQKVDGSEDLYGLRSYQQGEPLTRVDWKAYARERGLFVREMVNYQTSQLCFSWHDFPGVADETRLSYLTYMVLDAASQNLNYSLELPGTIIPYGDGELHRNQCLNALALYGIKIPESDLQPKGLAA